MAEIRNLFATRQAGLRRRESKTGRDLPWMHGFMHGWWYSLVIVEYYSIMEAKFRLNKEEDILITPSNDSKRVKQNYQKGKSAQPSEPSWTIFRLDVIEQPELYHWPWRWFFWQSFWDYEIRQGKDSLLLGFIRDDVEIQRLWISVMTKSFLLDQIRDGHLKPMKLPTLHCWRMLCMDWWSIVCLVVRQDDSYD